MRARIVVPIVIVAIAGAILAVALSRRGAASSTRSGAASSSGALPARTVDAGGVEVKILPLRLDDGGAVFQITLDTHTGDLSLDLTRAARLEIGGSVWRSPAWKGDPPGGHHREGELSFTPAGAVSGDVTLTIRGLPGPVVATWAQPAR